MHRRFSWIDGYLKWRKQRRGAAIVEFAVVLPIFLMLIFGSVEIGRAVMVKHIIEEGARAGCRVAIMKDAGQEDVMNIVDQAMDQAKITGYAVTITPDPPTSAAHLDPITVSISVPYEDVSWLSSASFLGGKTLVGTCVMPAERGTDGGGGTGTGGGTDPNTKKAKKNKSDTKKNKKNKKNKKDDDDDD